jgi:Orsellinic acid/F9775 biosynthesis cluster protein D
MTYTKNEIDGCFHCECKEKFANGLVFYSHRKYRCAYHTSKQQGSSANQLKSLVRKLTDRSPRKIKTRIIQGRKFHADPEHPMIERPNCVQYIQHCHLVYDKRYNIVVCMHPNCEHIVPSVRYHLGTYHREVSASDRETIHNAFDEYLHESVATLPHPSSGNPPMPPVAGLPIFEGYICPAPSCYHAAMNRNNMRHHIKKEHADQKDSLPRPVRAYVQCLHLTNKLGSFLVEYAPAETQESDKAVTVPKIHSSLSYVANEASAQFDENEATQLQFTKEFRFEHFIMEDFTTCAQYLKEPKDGSSVALYSSLLLVCQYFLNWVGSRLQSQPARLLQLIYSRSL